MDDNKQVRVANNTNSQVGYTIPDMGNLHRTYSAKEEKIITYEELRKLSYVPGGWELLKNYLVIKDNDVLKALNMQIEPEYFYGEKEVTNLLENGTLDEFLDCLDFAPEGVLELIKDLSVSLPLNDVRKRKAILDKLGFDVDKAVEIKTISEEETAAEAKTSGRRAAVPGNVETSQTQASTGRRVIIKTEE